MTVCKVSGILHMRKQQKPLPLLGVELPSLGVRSLNSTTWWTACAAGTRSAARQTR